jgi:prephenate dehydrogenase
MRSAAIAGLGLIGGSMARGLTAAGWRVLGVDRPRPLRAALRAGAIARGFDSLAEAAAEVDVVVLAAPPRANLALLRALARLTPPPRVVTDVGSVKAPICAAARALGLTGFVGGHPMAGRERGGFAASTPDLFAGRTWVLTPGAPVPAAALRTARALARALGARVVTLDAAAHDRAVAFVSHLPQLASWALRAAAAGDPVAARHLRVAGPGFADMTRLARSPRALWRQILGENGTEVKRALDAFRRALAKEAGALARPRGRGTQSRNRQGGVR